MLFVSHVCSVQGLYGRDLEQIKFQVLRVGSSTFLDKETAPTSEAFLMVSQEPWAAPVTYRAGDQGLPRWYTECLHLFRDLSLSRAPNDRFLSKILELGSEVLPGLKPM